MLTICSVAPGSGRTMVSGNFHFAGSSVATEMSAHELVRWVVKDADESGRTAIASRTTARSYAVFAIGPAESKMWETGTMPPPGTRPMVGLIVYSEARPAGQIREPSVSAPMETGA